MILNIKASIISLLLNSLGYFRQIDGSGHFASFFFIYTIYDFSLGLILNLS